MATGGIQKTRNAIEENLLGMVQRGRSISSFLNRNIFNQYKKAQQMRWQTQNASETGQWQALNPEYAKRKRKKYAAYPGGGTQVMIATSHLAEGAQGANPGYFYKLVTDTSFVIGINTGAIPYAVYPGELRPYMEFADATIEDWESQIMDYVAKNKVVE
jgi:hypothetical protein